MRVLYIHAKNFKYKPLEKVGITAVENIDPREYSFSDVLVVFLTIEKGDFIDRENILNSFLADVKNQLDRLKADSLVIYPYAHLSDNLEEPSKALRMLKLIDRKFKKDIPGVAYHRAPFGWYKEFILHCLGHPLSELSRKF